MKTITYKDITVRIYTNPMEYALMDEKPFGDIPEGAVFAGVVNVEDKTKNSNTAGFTTIEDRIIRIYVGEEYIYSDLLETVSHEIGHLIEGGYKKNPPIKDRYYNKHEEKAKHYENFVMDCYYLTDKIMLKTFMK